MKILLLRVRTKQSTLYKVSLTLDYFVSLVPAGTPLVNDRVFFVIASRRTTCASGTKQSNLFSEKQNYFKQRNRYKYNPANYRAIKIFHVGRKFKNYFVLSSFHINSSK